MLSWDFVRAGRFVRLGTCYCGVKPLNGVIVTDRRWYIRKRSAPASDYSIGWGGCVNPLAGLEMTSKSLGRALEEAGRLCSSILQMIYGILPFQMKVVSFRAALF